ncbi:MAG TPA: lysylphosphatidylglycerol synthase domain-containing protein [Natronosporangium sp.]
MAKPKLRRLLEAAVVAAFLGFIGWAAARQWRQVSSVIGELSAPSIAASFAAALAGIWFSFLCWRAILTDFGSRVPVTAGMRIFFVGQAGKYVPGKVWPILTQVKLGRDYQVPGRSSAAAALIFMLIVLGSGLLVAICSLPVLGADGLGRYWWALLALPVAAVVLWPPVLNWALARAMRLLRREPMPQPLSAGGIGRAVGWAIVMWLLYGVHLWVLLAALDVAAPNLLFRSIGAFAGAWSIGFLLAIAPAGVGPREVALVVLLAASASQPQALVAAVVSRLLMTLGDLAWPLVALALARRRRRQQQRQPQDAAGTAGTAAPAPPVRD